MFTIILCQIDRGDMYCILVLIGFFLSFFIIIIDYSLFGDCVRVSFVSLVVADVNILILYTHTHTSCNIVLHYILIVL